MRKIQLITYAMFAALLLECSSACSVPKHVENSFLSESAAIARAEAFITANGYTEAPPTNTKFVHESIQFLSDEETMEMRHNSLEATAYGVCPGRKGNVPGWTVVFRRPGSDINSKTGRAVTMDRDGSNIRVEHVDFNLKYLDKKLK